MWMAFAFVIALALIAIPLGVARSRSASASTATGASGAPAPAGWSPYTAIDGTFAVTAPADARSSVVTTGIGPARRVQFGDGTLSVTWLATPTQGTDQEALQTGKASLLRPLVGRTADEEVDLVDDGHPGFGLLITLNGTSYDVRLFASNGRLFQVVGSAPAGTPQVDDAIRFVDSFHLT
jgi:hypothetical protein